MHSIKAKLILGISVLVIFLFSVTALLLIDEKKKELSNDIYAKARSMSELGSPKVVELYESLLAENAFVKFTSELKDILHKDEDISAIKLHTFGGDTLYDSTMEIERQYSGEPRKIGYSELLSRVKSVMPSYLLASGRTVYLKKNSDSTYSAVNDNDNAVEAISNTDSILNIIYPVGAKYAVEFDVTYKNLDERVARMTERIVLLLVLGVLLGLGFGYYFSGKLTGPIEKLKAGAILLATGDFKVRVNVKTRDEIGLLADTFNKMAGDLEVSTKALVYKERMAKELELAAKLQKQILPEGNPEIAGLDVSASVLPATEIGGDCYDFIKVDADTDIIYISDVTGHGIPAGIVVSIANAIIYSYSSSEDLKEILVNANAVMREKTAKNIFMTLLMLRYSKGNLSYVSAGHPEMLHYYANEQKVSVEKGGGIALGMVPDIGARLSEESVKFEKGDCIVLYSDGIPEALSPKGEQYGLARMKRSLSSAGELPNASAIRNAILADVKEFMAGAEQADDITAVVIKKK